MTEHNPATNPKVTTMLKNLSAQDFKDFGLEQIAYIRTIEDENNTTYSIHSADGTELSVLDTLNQAIMATRQNDLEPVIVH